jgi:hypothetical protein
MMGGGRKDGAIINMSLNSRTRQSTVNRGITGSRLAAQAEALNNKAGRVLDRAIASRKKAEREALKPAKKQRSAESLRISRAKQVEKRRSINITNPAGRREDAAAKMAANAARTQKRALDFYKQKGRALKTPAPAPKSLTRTKGSKATLPRTPGTIAKPRGLKPGALKASRIAKGKSRRAAEPLGRRLNRVYIRAKAIEANNDPGTFSGQNTSKNDRSFGTARKAASFLNQGNKAWSDRARLSTGKKPPVMKTTVLKPEARVPASQRPGSMTNTLRATMGALAKADARRIREIQAITGQKVKPTAASAKAGKEASARVRATAKKGKATDTLRAGLRELAQSDARTAREMAAIVRDATPKVAGAKGAKAMRGGRAALPAEKPKPAKPAAAVKAKPPVARKGKTVEQVRKQWDERIAPSFKRRKSAIEKIPNEKERRNKLIALTRREKSAGGALLKKLGELQNKSGGAAKPTAPKRTRSARPAGTIAKPKGLKPSPVNKAAAKPMKAAVQFRSRKQAASAQKERNRRLYEFAGSAPGTGLAGFPGRGSMKRKATNVSQGNLLTGKVDSVKASEKITFGRSRIGRSAISKKNEQRRSRAEARYETLLQERKAIMRRGRVKGGELATNTQRMAAVSGAFRVYDMGTGRKPKRKSTGRQRARNSRDMN